MARRSPTHPDAPRPAELRRRLLAWWDAGHRDFPWRFPQRAADPYRVWLAEVMAQQTRLASALPFYRRFVERWPTLEALAAADDGEVLAAWSGLGYYARARHLLAASREALARHGGLPASLEGLRALPGLGPYTAGAVASIAFGIPVPAVDGNALRVLARLSGEREDPRRPAARRRLEALAAALVAPLRPGDLNQAVLVLGASVCTPRFPSCTACPLASSCRARIAGREGSIPPPRRRPGRRPLELALARLERGGCVLVVRKEGGGLLGGLWGLPAVEVGPGRDPRRALGGALRALVGPGARVGSLLAVVRRELTHRELVLSVYSAAFRRGAATPDRGPEGLRWASVSDIESLGISTAMRRAMEAAEGQPGHLSGVMRGPRAPRRSYPAESP
jgi:A/G-specific adenine glycosylase